MLDSLIYVFCPQSGGGGTLSVGARAEGYLGLRDLEQNGRTWVVSGKKRGDVVGAVDTNSDHPEATPESSWRPAEVLAAAQLAR